MSKGKSKSKSKSVLHCECGGALRPAKAAKFDFSPLADGLQVTLQNVPILRCGRCGEETLDGAIIDGTLNSLARSLATTDAKLGGIELRFLRKHLLLTQQELAIDIGCDRVTVADWERDAQPISEQHAMRLRALVLGGKDLQNDHEKFDAALQAAFAAAREIQPQAGQILSNAVALLSKAASPPPRKAPRPTVRHVVDGDKLDVKVG